jgi:hypothetical protein
LWYSDAVVSAIEGIAIIFMASHTRSCKFSIINGKKKKQLKNLEGKKLSLI